MLREGMFVLAVEETGTEEESKLRIGLYTLLLSTRKGERGKNRDILNRLNKTDKE